MRAIRVRLKAAGEVRQGGVPDRPPQAKLLRLLALPAHVATEARAVPLEARGPDHRVHLLEAAVLEAHARLLEALDRALHPDRSHGHALREVAAVGASPVRQLALVQPRPDGIHDAGALDAVLLRRARAEGLRVHHAHAHRHQPEQPRQRHVVPEGPLEPLRVGLAAEEARQQDDAATHRQEDLLRPEAQILCDVRPRGRPGTHDEHPLALELGLPSVLHRVHDPAPEGLLARVRRGEGLARLPHTHGHGIHPHAPLLRLLAGAGATVAHRPTIIVVPARGHLRAHPVEPREVEVLREGRQVLRELPMRGVPRPRLRHGKILQLQALLVHVRAQGGVGLAVRTRPPDPDATQLVRTLEGHDLEALVEKALATHQAAQAPADDGHDFTLSRGLLVLRPGCGAAACSLCRVAADQL
mmetsp:Transcript_22880/g.52751  ORF Transcript_22880/g.52751 Transcript_22880/m.52751 type:complete len:414 (-) Transcript_22880:134-1375(-)